MDNLFSNTLYSTTDASIHPGSRSVAHAHGHIAQRQKSSQVSRLEGKPLQFTGPVLCTSTSSSPLVEELRTFLETSV